MIIYIISARAMAQIQWRMPRRSREHSDLCTKRFRVGDCHIRLKDRQITKRERYCTGSAARLIPNSGRRGDRRKHLDHDEGERQWIPARISRGLNPVGRKGGEVKRLAPVSPFYLFGERPKPPLARDDDNDRYNLGEVSAGSERHLPALKPLTFVFGSRKKKRRKEEEGRGRGRRGRETSVYF